MDTAHTKDEKNARRTHGTAYGTWEIRAIAPAVLEELRRLDDAGREPRRLIDEDGGLPLRCCLDRSSRGEEIALVGYAPLRRWARERGADPGAYDEVGPVFIHPADCGGRPGTADGAVPDGVRGERRVLRAYSADGRILGGRLLDGPGAPSIEEGLTGLYADPAVAAVHVRAVEFGCFQAETRRR